MQDLQNIDQLFNNVVTLIKAARRKVYTHADIVLVETNWQIGRSIVEEEQQGEKRASYGKAIIASLASKLSTNGEKGFDATNLRHMRNFYLQYPNYDSLRRELSWTHYRQLLRISEPEKRAFYEIECAKSNWATRELNRQINSMLYERLALSRDKQGVIQLSKQGAEPTQPLDIIKDPFMLEFLGLSEQTKYLEKDLEQALIDKLQLFLLELGRGFSFVARQKRITLDGDNFYIDLVFYHYILKCFVIIDLKIGTLTHQDIGQMQMYVNYYERELTLETDNPPIGILLCADKNEAIVKYTLNEHNKQIFASNYKLQLPTESELKEELLRETAELMLEHNLRDNDK